MNIFTINWFYPKHYCSLFVQILFIVNLRIACAFHLDTPHNGADSQHRHFSLSLISAGTMRGKRMVQHLDRQGPGLTRPYLPLSSPKDNLPNGLFTCSRLLTSTLVLAVTPSPKLGGYLCSRRAVAQLMTQIPHSAGTILEGCSQYISFTIYFYHVTGIKLNWRVQLFPRSNKEYMLLPDKAITSDAPDTLPGKVTCRSRPNWHRLVPRYV